MDCCKFGEYRAHAHASAQAHAPCAAWDGYGPYAQLPYAPYAHHYYAHDPYARHYRYDYPTHHMFHAEHVMPMDYGVYASKETRVRRSLARREQRAHTPGPQHLPLPPTPPLECGLNGRSSAYCEPQIWSHYQMGVMGSGGWNGANTVNGAWVPRSACSRDHMRYPSECRSIKAMQMHSQNQICLQDERSTPFPAYEDSPYGRENCGRQRNTPEFTPSISQTDNSCVLRESFHVEPRRSTPDEKIPTPVIPLPAFQQAFGSTEIGKFAEAFSRTEVAADEISTENFIYDSYSEWDGSIEPQWSSQPGSREIKCEDNF